MVILGRKIRLNDLLFLISAYNGLQRIMFTHTGKDAFKFNFPSANTTFLFIFLLRNVNFYCRTLINC